RIGRAGDFYTASSVSNHFGRLLARQVRAAWQSLDQPVDFTVVECGAGTGHLAADLLTELQTSEPSCFRQLRYVICESSAAMRAEQAARLAGISAQVAWSELEALADRPITGLLLSNELVDALPVHRLTYRDGQCLEAFVTVSNKRLQLIWETPTQPEAFADYMTKGALALTQDTQYEVALDAVAWLEKAAAALARGYLVTIDYGGTGEYLSGRPSGSLRCFSHHQLSDDVFANIGRQDITADVNFSALINYGMAFGLQTVQLTRQTDYLIKLGLLDMLQETTLMDDTPESLKSRLALKHFLVPGGFGDRFKVLVQVKGENLPAPLPR
ncbi:MAG: SAM-dependent methyltransferase, partial [Chloracidobacterium sp.]